MCKTCAVLKNFLHVCNRCRNVSWLFLNADCDAYTQSQEAPSDGQRPLGFPNPCLPRASEDRRGHHWKAKVDQGSPPTPWQGNKKWSQKVPRSPQTPMRSLFVFICAIIGFGLPTHTRVRSAGRWQARQLVAAFRRQGGILPWEGGMHKQRVGSISKVVAYSIANV